MRELCYDESSEWSCAHRSQRLSSGQPFNRIASLDVPARRFGSADFELQPGMGPSPRPGPLASLRSHVPRNPMDPQA